MQTASSNGSTGKLPPHPCWLEVDLDAVAANVRALKGLVGSSTALAAVVKADAYGLGAVAVGRTALTAGADWLAVVRLEEGLALRRAGIQAPILNLAYTSVEEAPQAIAKDITPTVADLSGARALAAGAPRGQTIAVHLKVDTGLTRFGAQSHELVDLLEALSRLPSLRVEGLYSHFACADESDLSFTREQLKRFLEAEETVRSHGFSPTFRHISNSAGTLALRDAHLDLVRAGITLSGHYPSSETPRTVTLRPALSFRARLARVYDLEAGVSVGYGRTFTTSRAIRAGLLPVGYADGLPRAHSNHAQVLVHGRRAGLIGRVSMDQCIVDLSAVPDARQGDVVTVIGKDGAGRIELEEFAAWGDTIAHEALCRLGARVPRYYRVGGILHGPSWVGRISDVPTPDEILALPVTAPSSNGVEHSNGVVHATTTAYRSPDSAH